MEEESSQEAIGSFVREQNRSETKKRVELLPCRGELNPQQSFGPDMILAEMNCSRCNMTAMTAEGADSTKHTMQSGGD
jgi:hypothetical protein